DSTSGGVFINVNGGLPPYSYTWTNGSLTKDIVNLSQNTYGVTVTDDNGCTGTVSVNAPSASPIVFNAAIDFIKCYGNHNGSIEITEVQNGSGVYQYKGNNGISNKRIENLGAGVYSV